jgi:predicted secreted protein
MRRSLLPALLAVLLVVAGCGDDSKGDDPREEPDTTVATDDPAAVLTAEERDVQVEVGDTVLLELDENQSVGDLWEFAEEPDAAVLELVDDSYEIDDPGTDGGGGTARFVFEAVGDGGTTFVMHNCFRCDDEGNSSEDSGDADLEFSVEVTA